MSKNQIHRVLISSALSLLTASRLYGFSAGVDPDLVGWWTLDEMSGTTANDSSGFGHRGEIYGDPEWVPGILGGALLFNGTNTYINCGNPVSLQIVEEITLACWLKTTGFTNNWATLISKGDAAWRMSRSAETGNSVHMGVNGTTTTAGGNPWFDAGKPVTNDEWQHVAGVYDGTQARIYINGVQEASLNTTGPMADVSSEVYIGANADASNRFLSGTLDDVRIYRRALLAEEIRVVMQGYTGPVAIEPSPDDGAGDVSADSVLTWTPGPFARTHDVYLGVRFADVNTADRSTPNGVLVRQGQAESAYAPEGPFAFGQTYYWRVDEVNAAPDATIYRGAVWSFTVEPYAYPVQPIQATASSSLTANMGPEKTIDGSGLDAEDLHGTSSTQMWLSKSTPAPAWIQYEFDRAYKLHEMWVWNSNQSLEPYVGYGARDVLVEVSLDGTTWTTLGETREFAKAPGRAGYAHNSIVDLEGVLTRFVRLTIDRAWSGAAQAGLSEVRFFAVPVQAFGPQPADGAVDVGLNTVLTWRSGREAALHDFYFGADAGAVAEGSATPETVTEARYPLSDLSPEYGRTYTWRIDEVNDATDPVLWQGSPWTFTTIGYGIVDDFESYDDLCARIFFTWTDGFGHNGSETCAVAPSNGNNTGSTVGNFEAPFAERSIVHSGRQSMPFEFDNTASPFRSEALREWTSGQSWTTGGATALTLYVQGDATAFTETAPGTFVMNGTGTDIWNTADQFRFAYGQLRGNGSIVARVDAVSEVHPSAKAAVMIRDSLDQSSPYAAVVVTPASGIGFERRTTTGANAEGTTQPGLTAPYWVKLTRSGNRFTAQRSVDGVTWTSITEDASASTVTIDNMSENVTIGLAVTSHVVGVVGAAKFSQVATEGDVSGTWQVAEIGVAQIAGNAPETFYVGVEDSNGRLKTVRHPDPLTVATGFWEAWRIPLGEFTSAGIDLNTVTRMILGVGDPMAPAPGGQGILYIDDIRLSRDEP